MKRYKEILMGELIGIARATDGNEHLISDESTVFLRECLKSDPVSEEEFRNLMNRAAEVKKSMVPDCFLCANPCGRTVPFDLCELDGLDPGIREIKLKLMDHLITLSGTGRGADRLFYQGLIVIGMEDYPEAGLLQILQETEL